MNDQRSNQDPERLLDTLARKVIWWEEPAKARADNKRLLAYLMTFGDLSDVVLALNLFSRASFIEALEAAPPGVFDPRSWSYWRMVFGLAAKPMPMRKLPD